MLRCIATHLGLSRVERRAQIADIAARIAPATDKSDCPEPLVYSAISTNGVGTTVVYRRWIGCFNQRLASPPFRHAGPCWHWIESGTRDMNSSSAGRSAQI
jgi:endonuclease/exonuclease/phosphatase family metal-dependent hydrolase